MVLRRGANKRRPANVDILDAIVVVAASFHRRLERIEIGDEKIDGRDGVIGQRLLMVRVAAHGEQPAMDLRVQGLDPPIHHLGNFRDLGDVDHLKPGVSELLGCAARRDDLNVFGLQRLGEVHDARLVADREQRAGNLSCFHVLGGVHISVAGVDQRVRVGVASAFDVPDNANLARFAHHAAQHYLRSFLGPAMVGEQRTLFD